MRRTAAETREHILEVATELFYWHGVRATGVDRIASAAGVSPNVLYRVFSTKDDLVAAYIDRSRESSIVAFEAACAAAGPDPRDQVLALFDVLAEQIRPEVFRGCACMMAMAEFPDEDLPAHRGAVAAKRWVRDRFGDLAAESGAADPGLLADHLMLVWEGTNATAQSLGVDGPPASTRALVETLLAHHTRKPSATSR